MELSSIIELISTVGFPIACVICLGAFIFYVYKKQSSDSAANMDKVQARCKEREDKLYAEIKENREVNAKAIDTIAHYAEKLDTIQHDIHDIKNDITVIKAKEAN